ncbi:MAG: 4-hydroxy-tetrahydrodipicolinate synthase [Armatimonadetes bacterium]|nr:4-hydroxy-tetrahydrodipicolinate synthase [Armatimonadota bacterium]
MWGSLLTAIVTPFDAEGRVSYSQAEKLACHLLGTGSQGIVVSGTTGESPTLSFEEKVQMLKTVKAAVGDRAAVIAGTGSYNTYESIELTEAAEKAGADGIMLVVPYYNRPSQEGLYQHFKTIASHTGLPVLLYNIPGRTGCNMEATTVVRLSEVPNIVAVKEASKNLETVTEIAAGTPDNFYIYSGDDSLTIPTMSVGGCGVISVISHVAGKPVREMIDTYLSGDIAGAAKKHQKLAPLCKALFVTTNPVPVKAALNMIGIEVGGVRLPLIEANAKEKDIVRNAMAELGLAG